MCHFLGHTRFLVSYITLLQTDLKKSNFPFTIRDTFLKYYNCIFAKLLNCSHQMFSVQYCSININMCAKFFGAEDKNDLNMDHRMSPGPVLYYGGTPKIGLFFQLFGHFQYFWLKVPIIVCFSCIEKLLVDIIVKKKSSISDIKQMWKGVWSWDWR